MAVTSVVIPAHNEARVIGRLLGELTCPPASDPVLDIVVVANGCTDDTAEIATSFGPGVRVAELAAASKRAALDAGDRLAREFPRIYVDADVELHADDVQALAAALRRPGVLAAAPERVIEVSGRPALVRWYYDTWARLPQVRAGLFGRGVIGVSEAGHERLASLPALLADDLAGSLVFAPGERAIVPQALVVVHAPRTLADLMRRRVRAALTVAQLERVPGAPPSTARTRPADLAAIAWREPRMAPEVAFFVLMAVLARLRARQARQRVGYSNWLRDESSRLLMRASCSRNHSKARRPPRSRWRPTPVRRRSRTQATEKTATTVRTRSPANTRFEEPCWDSGPVTPTGRMPMRSTGRTLACCTVNSVASSRLTRLNVR